jgi:nucleoside-diphosphate-sugar epimerase
MIRVIARPFQSLHEKTPVIPFPDFLASYQGARVCVTGATGFLGGHLVRALLAAGAHVRVLVRDPTRLEADLVPAVQIVQGDLKSESGIREAVADAQWVFHCAANVTTWGQKDAYEEANVDGVRNLIASLADAGNSLQRLVHVSTFDVYGFPDHPADEDTPLPINRFGYGQSKRRGEELLRTECTRLNLPYSVIRPGNIIGPGSPFIVRIGKELQSGLMLKIGKGDIHAGLIEVDNLVNMLLWSGVVPQAKNMVLNARDPWDVTWAMFLSDFRRQLQGRGLVLRLGYRPAMLCAQFFGGIYGVLRVPAEPLLHPLIVDIFGKTCGHSIDRACRMGAPLGRVDYPSSLARSVDWLRAQKTTHATVKQPT